MAKNPGTTSQASKRARPAGGQTPVVKGATPDAPRRPFNPAQFVEEVRAEARKITWTTRQETWITSVMVFIMVLMTALFFLVVDQGLRVAMSALLKFAS